MKKWLIFIGVPLLAGCFSLKPVSPIKETSFVAGGANARVVVIGLTQVEPAKNNGWKGECPGCDIDAAWMFNQAKQHSISAELLYNQEATWPNVSYTILAAAQSLKAGDLLILFMSGHGGQVKDDNGDEQDGLDETICLWDGQVRDDKILQLLHSFPSGLRVVLINDQCHSEGNFRAFGRVVQQAVSFGAWGKKKARPIVKELAPTPGWSIQLIQFAGCREAVYSYGSSTGGSWSQCLGKTLREGMSWKEWFDAAQAIMPPNQVPAFSTYGKVTPEFLNGPVFK